MLQDPDGQVHYTGREIRFILRYAAWLIHGRKEILYTENGKCAPVESLVVSGTGKISTLGELGKRAERYMTYEQRMCVLKKKIMGLMRKRQE